MTPAVIKEVSVQVAEAHDIHEFAAFRVTPKIEPFEGILAIRADGEWIHSVHGRRLGAKRDIRKELLASFFENDILDHPGLVIWSAYDEVFARSSVGIGFDTDMGVPVAEWHADTYDVVEVGA